MGGYEGGSFASRKSVEFLKKNLSTLNNIDELTAPADMKKFLTDMDTYVQGKKKEEKKFYKAGATASIVKIFEANGKRLAVIGTLGDSRTYIRGRDGSTRFASEDQSYIWMNKKLGKLGEEKAEMLSRVMQNATSQAEIDAHKELVGEDGYYTNRNVIIQSIGNGISEADVQIVELRDGDEIIITSDGVHDNLTQKEIDKILSGPGDAKTITTRLMESAYERSCGTDFRSKPDDVTVVAVLSKKRATRNAVPASKRQGMRT